MVTNNYLKWLSETDGYWWTDTAEYGRMAQDIENGATGVTTNPILIMKSLYANPEFWRPYLDSAVGLSGDEKAEEILRCITVEIAKIFLPIYEKTAGVQGYVCAQVNPKKQGDTAAMIEMGRRLAAWAPNIAVKVPGTAAGLRAIEELAAEGITTVGTVSFTASQVVSIAAAQQRGIDRCRAAGKKPGAAFSVLMVGRIDDYLRDVAYDMQSDVKESDIICAGTAAIKNAYKECKTRGYEAKIMPAGMRGAYHATALAGSDMTFSLSAGIVDACGKETEMVEHINDEVSKETIANLKTIPEFVRAYEIGGLDESEFIRFGASQRTLSQFVEAGWGMIASFKL